MAGNYKFWVTCVYIYSNIITYNTNKYQEVGGRASI